MKPLLDLGYRAAYRAGFAAARIVWYLRRPLHEGALVALLVGDEVLMVRQSYRRSLSLPGGGVERGETPAQAASRELTEELGVALAPGALRHVHTETGIWDGRRDTVTFFEVRLDAPPRVRTDNREIVEARFLPLDALGARRVTGPVAAYLAWRAREAQAQPADASLASA